MMTLTIAIRTSLFSLTLLAMSSIVFAQEAGVIVIQNRSTAADKTESIEKGTIETRSIETSTGVISNDGVAVDANPSTDHLATLPLQANPGERVTNPDHLILNFDTTLGGGEVKGTRPHDYGYRGPGDMRTHLWNGHSSELIRNGITENKLMAMSAVEVQKWHNHFHGVEGSPDHPHHDGEPSHFNFIVEQSSMIVSSIDSENTTQGTIVYEGIGDLPSVFGQTEIIYQPDGVTEGEIFHQFETQSQSTLFDQAVIQSWSTDY